MGGGDDRVIGIRIYGVGTRLKGIKASSVDKTVMERKMRRWIG